MKKIKIDFKEINNDKEFYEIVREKLDLPEYFGDNLDALWDSITGYIELPIKIRFLNFNNNNKFKFRLRKCLRNMVFQKTLLLDT